MTRVRAGCVGVGDFDNLWPTGMTALSLEFSAGLNVIPGRLLRTEPSLTCLLKTPVNVEPRVTLRGVPNTNTCVRFAVKSDIDLHAMASVSNRVFLPIAV